MMTISEAVDTLKKAGLYVRDCRGVHILGGSHVDASSGLIRVVENGFHIYPYDTAYGVRTVHHGQGPGVTGISLEEAVKLVIETTQPQPNIEAPPRPVTKGPVYY